MMKTYHGSCHCGAVAYETDIDLAEGTLKCNCSICAKNRFWQVAVKSERFRLIRDEDALTGYLAFASRKEWFMVRRALLAKKMSRPGFEIRTDRR